MENYSKEFDNAAIMEMNERFQQEMRDAGIDEQEVLSEAKKNLNSWSAYFNENNVRAKEDLKFALGEQWTAAERGQMQQYFKPAMVFNKLYDAVKKISGEQRKHKPDLMVRSLTGMATQEEINLRTDLVRTISYKSQNDLIYQQAFKMALLCGYGVFEVSLDYESPKSFKKDIKFELVQDITQTSFDPMAKEPHKGDGNFCAVNYVYSKEEFYATYPWVKNAVSRATDNEFKDFTWGTKETITVSKYTQKHWYTTEIHLLSNGKVVTQSEWEKLQKEFKLQQELAQGSMIVGEMIMEEIPKIVSTRTTQDYFIRQYFLTENKIIQFMDWPSKQLPLVFVDGDSHYVDGLQHTRSFIHGAKDAQKFINFIGSETAADLKNRRREQWIGTSDNITGHEQMWKNPELQQGMLVAKPDPKTGRMPERMPPSEISQSLLTQYQRGNQDIREILGFSEQEALMGRDMSGKARRERKLEGSMSAYVYFDNLNQAIEQGGRIVLDLLPAVIGRNEYPIILTKSDGKTVPITLNQRIGKEIKNKLEAGNYDVEIDTGPSFAVQKEIALEFFQQTIAANPQTFNLIADLWAKNLDVQYMPQIADRFKTLVPPQILAQESGEDPSKIQPQGNPEMMQAMQLEQQKNALAQQELAMKEKELAVKQNEQKLQAMKTLMATRDLQTRVESDARSDASDEYQAQLSYKGDVIKSLAEIINSTQQTSNAGLISELEQIDKL